MRADLPKTRALLEGGIAEGLHLGGQLYVSRRGDASRSGESIEFAVGERAPGEPLTADHLMLWMSSTKPIAAVAIGRLWELGKLDLDDAVARHIPEFDVHGKGAITLRHVLTHTGGFRLLGVGWPKRSWEEIIAWICAARPEPRWTPGRKAGYHLSSSWFILGEIVRRVDGRHFSQYVREEIFEPLGMHDSWVGMPAERYRGYGDRLSPMWKTEDPANPTRQPWDDEPWVVGCSPGGNGRGPIRELGRFYETLLARGLHRRGDREHRLLAPTTLEALVTPNRVGMWDHTFRARLDWGLGFIPNSAHYLDSDGDGDRDDETLLPYGYGRLASRRVFGHSGFQSSTAFADPEYDLVVALAVNGNPGEPTHTRRFRDLVEAIYQDLDLVG